MTRARGGPVRASWLRLLGRIFVLAAVLVLETAAFLPAIARAADPPRVGQRGRPSNESTQAPSKGWQNPKALELAKEGIEAKKAGDIPLCLQKDQASLALEEHAYVKLHISSCLAAASRFKDALVNARDALAAGIKFEDEELKKAALARVQELLPKLGRLKIDIPDKTDNLKITLNGIPLRPNQVRDKLSLDPGEYQIEAVREEHGERYIFKEKITIGEGEERGIEVLPKRDHLPDETEACLRNAKNYKERVKCIDEPTAHPNVRVGLEMSGYTDSTNVHVITPAINAAVVSPTGGWNVGGSYLLDVVTAASPDLVSTASRPFREQRHAASLNGGYKLNLAQVGLNGNVSSEPDYLSRTLGANVSTELNDKLITPRFAYNFTWDTIGYRNTPFAQFSRPLTTHAIDAGVTFVMSPTTLLVTGISMSFERGENSKLYRFVPMFAEDIAARVQPGQAIDAVNDNRLNVRPRELVPQQRDRIAIGGRVNHRFPTGTLRIEQRFYTDTWGVKASTSDGRYIHDLGERLRVWPHARLHAQTSATFYQLAYAARTGQDGTPIEIPQFRTGDREASPMIGLTAGGGARIQLTSDKATIQYAVTVSGDVMYNRYLKSLFILSRTAVWGTVAFEAEL